MSEQLFSAQLKKALVAGSQRDYRTAIKLLESIILTAPDSFFTGNNTTITHVYLYLGRAWHCIGEYAKALYYLKIYHSFIPNDGTGSFFIARTYFAAKKYPQALRFALKSLATNPKNVHCLQLLGAINLKLKRSLQARAAFEKGLELDPENNALQRGYYNALFIDAIKQLRFGESDSARQMLTFLINNDVDGVIPRLYLAHAFRDLGALPEALSQYEAACQFAPDDPNLPWYIVATLFQLGQQQEAIAYIQNLAVPTTLQDVCGTRNVTWTEALVDTMIIRQDLEDGEYARAAQAARMYIHKNGSDPIVHSLMGEALRGSGSYDLAINHFMRAMELDRTNPAPRYGMLLVLLDKKDWQTLDKELSRAESAGCDPEILLYYRCITDAKLHKDPATVLARAQALLHEKPGDPHLMLVLAEQYIRIGMPELAQNWYINVCSMLPDNEEAAIGYIAACESLNDTTLLQNAYTAYLAKWSDNTAIRHDYIAFLIAQQQWNDAADNIEELLAVHSCDKNRCTIRLSSRNLAYCRRKAGQYRESAVIYRSILRKTPRDAASLYNLVYCLDKLGEPSKGRELLVAAAKFCPLGLELQIVLGLLLKREGKKEQALDAFRIVTNEHPDDWRAYHHVASIYQEEGIIEMAMQYRQEADRRKSICKQKAERTKDVF